MVGDFGHHFQICVEYYIPSRWVMFYLNIYQPLIYRDLSSLNMNMAVEGVNNGKQVPVSIIIYLLFFQG